MESIRIVCKACKHSIRLPASSRATQTKCPKCGELVEIAAARAASSGADSAADAADVVQTPDRERFEVGDKPKVTGPGSARPQHKPSGVPARSSAKERNTHRHASAKAKLPVPLLAGGACLVVGALALWFFVSRGGDQAPVTAAAPLVAIDLAALPDQERLEGTTDEDWAALNELVTRYRTPPFGPASVQCGDRLMIQGKRAIPAILNGLKRLDLATPEGADIGWKMQTLLLQGLCHDTNFGWRRETRPEDVHFNQQVVQRWFQAWEAAGTDDEAWVEIARLKAVPPGLAKSGDGSPSGARGD
jgi:predicted RNA-binding Zn-ribbon protein involved in translation (DUF1610 family)